MIELSPETLEVVLMGKILMLKGILTPEGSQLGGLGSAQVIEWYQGNQIVDLPGVVRLQDLQTQVVRHQVVYLVSLDQISCPTAHLINLQPIKPVKMLLWL